MITVDYIPNPRLAILASELELLGASKNLGTSVIGKIGLS